MTAAAYLAWEGTQPRKNELIGGRLHERPDSSRSHCIVCGNIAALLHERLRGTPCRAYMSDMKLRIEAADAFFYPDVMVSCDEADARAEHYLSAPRLIVEVLSPSTQG